jgi:hypothetical protein
MKLFGLKLRNDQNLWLHCHSPLGPLHILQNQLTQPPDSDTAVDLPTDEFEALAMPVDGFQIRGREA